MAGTEPRRPPPVDDREDRRIRFLVSRDGPAKAREWVRRTRDMYAAAIRSPTSHAGHAEYRDGFEASIRAFDRWLARNDEK